MAGAAVTSTHFSKRSRSTAVDMNKTANVGSEHRQKGVNFWLTQDNQAMDQT